MDPCEQKDIKTEALSPYFTKDVDISPPTQPHLSPPLSRDNYVQALSSFSSLKRRLPSRHREADLLQSSNSAAHPLLHPPPSATISPTTPRPLGGIDGLLLTVHTAARSCSDQGQPNIGRKREEHRGGQRSCILESAAWQGGS
ncbi:unnamed protein product [Pleuronectes platessa]|uniref:Uncharacterized protein n=1 Tax=Pleuronectes platessa TaxID=8262 RepID=A0A9N7UFJ3_PLEPL|nr:unnamed protein product [Pleuronectes platessa]